jgi:hypothetical protein
LRRANSFALSSPFSLRKASNSTRMASINLFFFDFFQTVFLSHVV